jgi:hypothetical protein
MGVATQLILLELQGLRRKDEWWLVKNTESVWYSHAETEENQAIASGCRITRLAFQQCTDEVALVV